MRPCDTPRAVAAIKGLGDFAECSYHVLLDAVRGWAEHSNTLRSGAQTLADENRITLDEALSRELIHQENSSIVSRAPVNEILARIAPRGANEVFLGNMSVVSIYSFWETKTRSEFADALGSDREQLQWDLIGDLRCFRHAILHCGGVADRKVANAKSCRWFKEGDRIVIDRRHLAAIVNGVRKFEKVVQLLPNGVDLTKPWAS